MGERLKNYGGNESDMAGDPTKFRPIHTATVQVAEQAREQSLLDGIPEGVEGIKVLARRKAALKTRRAELLSEADGLKTDINALSEAIAQRVGSAQE